MNKKIVAAILDTQRFNLFWADRDVKKVEHEFLAYLEADKTRYELIKITGRLASVIENARGGKLILNWHGENEFVPNERRLSDKQIGVLLGCNALTFALGNSGAFGYKLTEAGEKLADELHKEN